MMVLRRRGAFRRLVKRMVGYGWGKPMKEWAHKTFEVNSNTSNRWYSMEGMRGLAVILVFFVHYHSVIGEYSVKDSFGYIISSYFGAVGHTGVDLFFVLSGYLIYGALIRKKVNLKIFYKKRIFRIYPTFTAVLILYLLVSIIFKQESKFGNLSAIDSFIYIVKNFFLLPGIFSIKPIITVAWSLSYEIFYYLATPIIISVLRMRTWTPQFRIAFFLLITFLFLYLCEIGVLSRIRISMFIAGIILYDLINAVNFYNNPPKFSSMIAILMFFVSIISFGEINSDRYSLIYPANFNSQFTAMIILFFSFIFFIISGLHETRLSKILSFSPLRYLGNMSYSYYLIHGITIKFVGLILSYLLSNYLLSGLELWIMMPAVFFITLISSTILFILVEKPFSIEKKI